MSINPTALGPYREAMGADADTFVIELIDTFLTGTQEFIVALYESISTGDAKVFSRAAHTLKSNSSIFGAELLASMALELEKAGKTEDLTTLLPKVDRLKIEYDQVCHELVDLRRSLSS